MSCQSQDVIEKLKEYTEIHNKFPDLFNLIENTKVIFKLKNSKSVTTLLLFFNQNIEYDFDADLNLIRIQNLILM